MKQYAKSILIITLMVVSTTAVANNEWTIPSKLSFHEARISRDELRQQKLARITEYRAAFIQPAYADNALLIIETYNKSEPKNLYYMTSSINWSVPKEVKSFISAGFKTNGELALVYDNGLKYGPFSDYRTFTKNEFSNPTNVHYFESAEPEIRVNTYSEQVTLFPVMAFCGNQSAKMRNGKITLAKDYISECTEAHGENALVVYLYFIKSGLPALKWSN